jgi:succinate dehydrogenase / fumarate reductase, cytochrome b subunit
MRALLEFYNSSVGKKLIVAMTGLFLISFLVIHLFGNLLILRNDAGKAFDAYAEALPQIVVIRIIEIGLFLILLLHIITGALTWYLNKKARGSAAYDLQKKSETSALSSRTMLLTGSIVYIFLVIHMRQFWFTSRYEAGEHFSMYEIVRWTFSMPIYSVFYIIAMFLLGFHLKHGFQSAFQTFGLRNKKYETFIEWIGAIFWLAMPIAFAVMPLYFLLNL